MRTSFGDGRWSSSRESSLDTQAGWLRMALPMWLLEKKGEEGPHAENAEVETFGSKNSLSGVTQTDDFRFMRRHGFGAMF